MVQESTRVSLKANRKRREALSGPVLLISKSEALGSHSDDQADCCLMECDSV